MSYMILIILRKLNESTVKPAFHDYLEVEFRFVTGMRVHRPHVRKVARAHLSYQRGSDFNIRAGDDNPVVTCSAEDKTTLVISVIRGFPP